MIKIKRVAVSEQEPKKRAKNFDEVCLGYTDEDAIIEASRCLNCKNPRCMTSCPVSIEIPRFVQEVKKAKFKEAAKIISRNSSLPAI